MSAYTRLYVIDFEDEFLATMSDSLKRASLSLTVYGITVDEYMESKFEKSDILVVSDYLIDTQEMVDMKLKNPLGLFFYVVGNSNDSEIELRNVQLSCLSHDIKYIPPNLSNQRIVDEVIKHINKVEKEQRKVVSFCGAIPRVGVTTSVLSIANAMSELADIKVGVIGLNAFSAGTSFLEYKGKYFDEIWGQINAKDRDFDLLNKMDRINTNCFYLAGNSNLVNIYLYNREGVYWLIEEARKKFDFVILDCGSHLDNALSAEGIYQSDFLFVQINQSLHAKEQWKRMRDQIVYPILGVEEPQIFLTFNQIYKAADVEEPNQIAKQLEADAIGVIPYVNFFYRYEHNKDLLKMDKKEYKDAVEKIAEALIDFYKLPRRKKEKTSNVFSFFGRKG